MSELQCIARIRIVPGKLEEYKRLSRQCAEVSRSKDTGTLQYEVYLKPDNTEAIAFERYRDSAALIEHIKNLGDLMGAILQTAVIEGEICGDASPELVEFFKGAPVQIYKPFLSTFSGKRD